MAGLDDIEKGQAYYTLPPELDGVVELRGTNPAPNQGVNYYGSAVWASSIPMPIFTGTVTFPTPRDPYVWIDPWEGRAI